MRDSEIWTPEGVTFSSGVEQRLRSVCRTTRLGQKRSFGEGEMITVIEGYQGFEENLLDKDGELHISQQISDDQT